MTYVITEACVDVKDRTCVRECPVDSIYEGPRSLYIHPEECIDCGACQVVCPTNAIIADLDIADIADDAGDAWSAAKRRNREVFTDIGSPLGAKRFGLLSADHPEIAALAASAATA